MNAPHPNLSTWTDTQLDLEHRRLCRWLDLPGSELWAEEAKAADKQARAIWGEMKRRKAARAAGDRRAA